MTWLPRDWWRCWSDEPPRSKFVSEWLPMRQDWWVEAHQGFDRVIVLGPRYQI